jgi:hypothetical protein
VLDFAETSVTKLLSYNPDNVDATLHEAQALTGGAFRERYSGVINETVIPGAE